MASYLEDLDELALRCRDKRAQSHIAEAISSYRAGAFRSAIVATWIAVCFDFIEKLRELALAGDKEAEKQVQDLEAIRRTGDLQRALRFERDLLAVARDKFELISPLEYIDLERLQADRNRCAHASLNADEQAYVPSAELARVHLHSAVTHLLQHPPVQGKFALDRLCQEVESEYFPTTTNDARTAFSTGPLRRPRDSLVRNFVLVITKALLKDGVDYKRRARLIAALQAVREMHPPLSSSTLAAQLSPLLRTIPDTDLREATLFVVKMADCWPLLEVDVQQRLQNYVEDLPSSQVDDLDELLECPPLRPNALKRVRRISKRELKDALFFTLPKEIAERLIELYASAETFDVANTLAKEVTSYSMDFTSEQVRSLVERAAKNNQCTGSFKFSEVMKTLRGLKKLPLDEFDQLLEANDIPSVVS